MTADKRPRLDLVRRVCGWATPLETETKDGLERSPEHIYFSNTSGEPVYELIAYLVYVQGAAASTGEEVESFFRGDPYQNYPGVGVWDVRAIVQILPPGNFHLKLESYPDHPQQGQLGLEVAFSDGSGGHWVRRVPSGVLEPLASGPVEHYGIDAPLDYNVVTPWQ
jgi:hypothetical protein